MYVARFTDNPENDIKRGWSGYFGHDFKTPYDLVKDMGWDYELLEKENVDTLEEIDQDDILYWLERNQNTDLRYDDHLKVWRVCHHDGLSCWVLDAETEADALTEASAKAIAGKIEWAGFGYRTIGTIKLVASVEGVDNLYIFECEKAEREV